LAEALKILSDHGDDARVLAGGGHSLIPMMKMRMANIPHLIDLQDIPDLAQISLEGNRVVIGAMVTQAQLINDQTLASAAPLMKEAALQIADPQVRYMGTVGGNVANGDPANDMPGLMQCLNADFNLIGLVTDLFRSFNLVFCLKGELKWQTDIVRNSNEMRCASL